MFNKKIVEVLKNKRGIEFGGPTELFYNPTFRMDLYNHVFLDGGNMVDDSSFKNLKGHADFDKTFKYGKEDGTQFNVDCSLESDLNKINKKYDFIVTSHLIEHLANPIKTIKNWSNLLLNEGGYVLSIIPHYSFCFDRNRPLTTIEHLINDYENNIGEDDKTHIEEQKKLHDWSQGGHPDFSELCENNDKTRVVHHHTFTPDTVDELFNACGLKSIVTFKHDNLNIVNLSQI